MSFAGRQRVFFRRNLCKQTGSWPVSCLSGSKALSGCSCKTYSQRSSAIARLNAALELNFWVHIGTMYGAQRHTVFSVWKPRLYQKASLTSPAARLLAQAVQLLASACDQRKSLRAQVSQQARQHIVRQVRQANPSSAAAGAQCRHLCLCLSYRCLGRKKCYNVWQPSSDGLAYYRPIVMIGPLTRTENV